MKTKITALLVCLTSVITACSTQPEVADEPDMAIVWVRDAAEYRAVSRQAYRAATLALPGMIADTDWSALPDQKNARDLPPAVIFDIDETVLTNPYFQQSFEPPFTDKKLNDWSMQHDATPVPGVTDFVALASQSGVEIFFATNRPCVANDGTDNPCPQKAVVIQDLIEAALPATESNVSLSGERENWGKEKKIRRDWIAEKYRVIMLFGDDLSDFIPCVRRRNVARCSEVPATKSSREALLEQYDAYWGAGWYVLPNPMHGSWTSFR
jgi:acid phosphatase